MTDTPLAIELCKSANVDFAKTFRYQYVVGPEPLDLPGFETRKIGAQYVHVGCDLRCSDLTDGTGQTIGVVLGVAVDHDGALPQEALPKLITDATSDDARDTFEDYLTCVAGRYAIIIQLAGQTLYYCDPVGMIGAVYAPETRRIGASLGLCIDRGIVDHPLYDHDEIAQGNGTYGFSHTRDMHVHRLNASHRFDLDGFFHTRFWPRADDSFEASPNQYGHIYDEMIAAERQIIRRMTQIGETAMPLTGGNDSRILLALTDANDRPNVTQFFSHINNYANRRDSVIGSALCHAAGTTNDVHDRKKIEVKRFVGRLAARSYEIACGMAGPAPREINNGLFQSVKEGAIVMRGHQCNILRGQYLTTANPDKWKEHAWHIRIMRLVGQNEFSSEVAARFKPDFFKYYNDLPTNAKARSADFIFFETLVPAALGTLFPGQSHAFYLSPFNSRRLVQLCMMPDTEYRLSNATTNDLILRAAPEIFAVPYSYEIPSDMHDTDESLAKRQERCEAATDRYSTIFGDPAPEIDVAPFDPTVATSS